MGNRVEGYANYREAEFKALKHSVMEDFIFNKLKVTDLEIILDEAFKMGHYVGHCRGEMYMKSFLGGGRNER